MAPQADRSWGEWSGSVGSGDRAGGSADRLHAGVIEQGIDCRGRAGVSLASAERLEQRMMLLCADLDDMKGINDNLGHTGGDLALKETAGMVPKWIPPGQRFWGIATGVAHLLAGLSIMTGVLADIASRLFTAMLIAFGILVWVPFLFTPADAHMVWGGNAINLALAGAAWIISDSIWASKKSVS